MMPPFRLVPLRTPDYLPYQTPTRVRHLLARRARPKPSSCLA